MTSKPCPFARPLVVLFVFALAAGCSKNRPAPPLVAPAQRAAGVPAPDIEQLLARMTLEEKVGQMVQVSRVELSGAEVRDLYLGSVLNGGNDLFHPNTPSGWADGIDRLQMYALSTRLGIPMVYGVDAVHGHAGVRGATVFPHNIGLGATRNPQLAEQVGKITALEGAATGVRWAFAPCIAVPRDERWGRTYEGFGETAELATLFGPAVVRGLQGQKLGAPDSILACAKHFVGDGATDKGIDQGDAKISEEELRSIHLPGYAAAVKAGVGSVMVSYSSWNGQRLHGQKYLITDVLKGELGFEGFVVSDWEGIEQMSTSFAENVENAINAGIDMAMTSKSYRSFIRTLKRHINAGRIPVARVDDAVRRILRVKAAAGLWEHPMANRRLAAEFGSPEHRVVARDAVRQSMVLLKNDKGVLPLGKTAKVSVTGSKAKDMGSQCGGWTMGWQGRTGPVTPGTTIQRAIEHAVAAGGAVTSARDADVVVVVVGETPYAEGSGDNRNPTLSGSDRGAIESARESGKPVVTVLVTGRPLVIQDWLSLTDALVVAWLPGTEGSGVADVLFGDYKPTGKLPHSWPRSVEQIPINQGDASYDPLFPYGFGLSY
ncbi:MAG: glycoside hydrolase family 3 C-terminal domain-containing protein [Deltaproteobacteria bacterium]|nr:glycoside hydrolase family 3 C-terminal domain-containing protein [Deltaproteobacteria bacterium]